MLWRTHFTAGATAGLMVAGQGASLATCLTSAAIAGIAALLPDIDSPHSKIGRLVPVLPRLLTFTIGHRGLFHSLAGAFTVSFLAAAILNMWRDEGLSALYLLVFAGYASHILIDCLTNSGCPVLYPLRWHINIPLVNTGSIMERLLVLPGMMIMFVWLLLPAI